MNGYASRLGTVAALAAVCVGQGCGGKASGLPSPNGDVALGAGDGGGGEPLVLRDLSAAFNDALASFSEWKNAVEASGEDTLPCKAFSGECVRTSDGFEMRVSFENIGASVPAGVKFYWIDASVDPSISAYLDLLHAAAVAGDAIRCNGSACEVRQVSDSTFDAFLLCDDECSAVAIGQSSHWYVKVPVAAWTNVPGVSIATREVTDRLDTTSCSGVPPTASDVLVAIKKALDDVDLDTWFDSVGSLEVVYGVKAYESWKPLGMRAVATVHAMAVEETGTSIIEYWWSLSLYVSKKNTQDPKLWRMAESSDVNKVEKEIRSAFSQRLGALCSP